MPWPIPVFKPVEYPKPISPRIWLPTLLALAMMVLVAVLLLWPHGRPTNTYQFWVTLVAAPMIACSLVFGIRLSIWEYKQNYAAYLKANQDQLHDSWREWTRRELRVIDAAAFPAATNKIAKFAESKIDLPSLKERSIAFRWASNRTEASRRTRLMRLIAVRFARVLRTRKEMFVTLMLDDGSLEQTRAWTECAKLVFASIAPAVRFHVEAQAATDGAQWITQLVDKVDPATRLVIAAQFHSDRTDQNEYSEGAAAFLIEPGASKAGSIVRPMSITSDAMKTGISQIEQFQLSSDRIRQVWSTACGDEESAAIRSAVTPDAAGMPTERLLDASLGNSGPASGWIALAIALESMRGAAPQLVAWREPKSASMNLCTILPLPHKESAKGTQTNDA